MDIDCLWSLTVLCSQVVSCFRKGNINWMGLKQFSLTRHIKISSGSASHLYRSQLDEERHRSAVPVLNQEAPWYQAELEPRAVEVIQDMIHKGQGTGLLAFGSIPHVLFTLLLVRVSETREQWVHTKLHRNKCNKLSASSCPCSSPAPAGGPSLQPRQINGNSMAWKTLRAIKHLWSRLKFLSSEGWKGLIRISIHLSWWGRIVPYSIFFLSLPCLLLKTMGHSPRCFGGIFFQLLKHMNAAVSVAGKPIRWCGKKHEVWSHPKPSEILSFPRWDRLG